jgi:hypothetical protein
LSQCGFGVRWACPQGQCSAGGACNIFIGKMQDCALDTAKGGGAKP